MDTAMPTSTSFLCPGCLRSAPDETRREGTREATSCPFCSGALERPFDSPIDTPTSLALTPDLEVTQDHPGIVPWCSPEGPAPALLDPTAQLGRFQIRGLLGGGRFGKVYLAHDPRLERQLALKVLKEVRPDGRVMERFFREARAAAQLDHPNIVPLFDAGRDAGRCWIAYQYVEGHTLAACRDARMLDDFVRAARIVRELADALDYAHRRGILHRDVKPSNVLVEPSGRPRLTDFGLALRFHVESTITTEGVILGTPAYMSPEQAAGQSHDVDARSDIYSLGAILHELLWGIPPARPDRSAARNAMEEQCPIARRVPQELARICWRALAREPSGRYAGARPMVEDLDSWLHSRTARRGRLAVVCAIGGMLGAAGSRAIETVITEGGFVSLGDVVRDDHPYASSHSPPPELHRPPPSG